MTKVPTHDEWLMNAAAGAGGGGDADGDGGGGNADAPVRFRGVSNRCCADIPCFDLYLPARDGYVWGEGVDATGTYQLSGIAHGDRVAMTQHYLGRTLTNYSVREANKGGLFVEWRLRRVTLGVTYADDDGRTRDLHGRVTAMFPRLEGESALIGTRHAPWKAASDLALWADPTARDRDRRDRDRDRRNHCCSCGGSSSADCDGAYGAFRATEQGQRDAEQRDWQRWLAGFDGPRSDGDGSVLGVRGARAPTAL